MNHTFLYRHSNINNCEGLYLTLPPQIFPFQVKSGACYITGQWSSVVTATVSFRGQFRIFIYQTEQTYVKQTRHLISFELVYEFREIYSTRLNDCGGVSCGNVCGFQSLTISKKSPPWMFGRFLNVPLKSFFDVPLLSLSVSSPIFLTWIPVKHPREIFFCRNG